MTTAAVRSCAGAQVRDSGKVIYVLVARDCASSGPLEISLQSELGSDTRSQTVTLPDFGVALSVELAPGEARELSVHRKGSWRSFANLDTWDWRDGAGLLAKDGGLYLLGGWSSDTGGKNDVWFTSDLSKWTRLVEHAPWPGRHGAAWVAHRNRLYVIGGDFLVDSWSSEDGVNWVRHTDTAPFGTRYTPNAVSINDQLVLYAGQGGSEGLNDVWASADGRSWQELVTHAPYAGRGLIHGSALFNGRIYVIGGGVKAVPEGEGYAETVVEYADIWSSADGIVWRREADTLGFAPRTHFAVLATQAGCWVANGSVGTQLNTSSEVFFAADCVHFMPIPDTSPMAVRHASSLVEFNGSIVVLGGHRDTAGTAIWQYFPDHSNNR